MKAESIGFQSPCDVLRQDAETLSWSFTGAGNRAGFTLEFEGDESTQFHFSSGPCSFGFRLDQVSRTSMRVDGGGLSRYVEVGPAPRTDGSRTVDLAYRDSRNISGICPYWVRIVQTDQARAWSSPVYVTRQS